MAVTLSGVREENVSTARGAGVVPAPSCNLGLCRRRVPTLATFVFTFGVFRLRHDLSRFICAADYLCS